MRHRKSGRKLKRTASHRRALLAALTTDLLRHKRITTTVAKAKETRMVVEKIITRAKNAALKSDAPAAGVHARRQVARLIKDRAVVADLFTNIAGKVASRPGGYTRIVKLGRRLGDAAEMAVIELVDYNTGKDEKEAPVAPAKEKKTRKPAKAEDAGSDAPGQEKNPTVKPKAKGSGTAKKKSESPKDSSKKESR